MRKMLVQGILYPFLCLHYEFDKNANSFGVSTVCFSQPFCKLFDHIIYGDIKTRYNVFRKYANDVFGEYDFVVQKLLKPYNNKTFQKVSPL